MPRSLVQKIAWIGVIVAGLAPIPAQATFGSATAAIIAQTMQQASQFVKSMLGNQQTNENIMAAGVNTTNSIKALAKANTLNTQQSTTDVVAAMQQRQMASGVVNLYKAQAGLTPPPASCMQTDAAEEYSVGATQASADTANSTASLALNNAGVPLDVAAAQSAHVTRITTATSAAAYQSAIAAQTQGRAFQSGSLFHPPPPPKTVSNTSGSPSLTPAQTATLFTAELTAPVPIGAPSADLSNSHGAAVWQSASLAANARLSLTQSAVRQTMRWRMPSPALTQWAQAISKMNTPSGVFMKQKVAQDTQVGVSSDVMLKWLTAARFGNPLWYSAMSGADKTMLIRSLVFMEAQSLAMQNRELRLLERMETLEAVQVSMQTRHRERRVIASLGATH